MHEIRCLRRRSTSNKNTQHKFWKINDKVVLFPVPPQEKMPLAVVGSNVVVEVNGKKVRGRQYPWGVAEGTSVQVQVVTALSFAAQGRWRVPATVSSVLVQCSLCQQLQGLEGWQCRWVHCVKSSMFPPQTEWCAACVSFPVITVCINYQGFNANIKVCFRWGIFLPPTKIAGR